MFNLLRVENAYIEDFETGDIQHTTEVGPGFLGIQSLVTFADQPLEDTFKDSLAQSFGGEVYLSSVA